MKIYKSIEIAKTLIPNLEIKFKDESKFMKILSKILFFNKDFMTNYTTTIGSTIYFPNREYLTNKSSIVTLCHEIIHVNQSKNILFGFLYLSPQIFSIFALLSIFNIYFLFFLLFLLPIPSPRAYFEYKAYCVSMYTRNELGMKIDTYSIFKQFNSANYYFMFPFKWLKNKLDIKKEEIENKSFNFKEKNIIDQIIDL